jgi:threonine/homoserine/homoserine lactone efflux protein
MICGVAIGFPAMLLLVTTGLGEALRAAPEVQRGLRWVGAAWLLWLAWRIATAEPAGANAAAPTMGFIGAALFQWVNPKAWLAAGGAAAAYAGEAGSAAALAAAFALAALASLGAWAALGAAAGAVLVSPSLLRWFNRAMGAVLAASVMPLL